MLVKHPEHETVNVDNEGCVADLASALGLWIGSSYVSEMQLGCFIYSVLKLAREAGVSKRVAIAPFLPFHEFAKRIWVEIENESDGTLERR